METQESAGAEPGAQSGVEFISETPGAPAGKLLDEILTRCGQDADKMLMNDVIEPQDKVIMKVIMKVMMKGDDEIDDRLCGGLRPLWWLAI